MNITELMLVFSNPETIKNMSLMDKMNGVGVTVVLGMGITIVALIFIQLLISGMTKILSENLNKTVETPTESKTIPGIIPEPTDPELMAAITAAVAAKMGVPEKNIIRTEIKRK